MPRKVWFSACFGALLVACLPAQARFTDPLVPVPRLLAAGAADPNNGDLWLVGGRRDRVLDLWRLRAGVWQQQADGPLVGQATAAAFDPIRQRLVTVLQRASGEKRLFEFDGAQWTEGPSLGFVDSQLVWDPVRQVTLVFSQASNLWNGFLQTWAGANLVPQFTFNVRYGSFGFDTARGRAVVVAPDTVYEWNGGWSQVSSQRPWLLAPRPFTDPWTGRVVLADSGTGAFAWTGSQWVAWAMHGMPVRRWPLLVGNPQRQRLQLFGGADNFPHGDTFESDGTTWTQVAPDSAAPAFPDPALVAIGERTALLFDGGGGFAPVQTARRQNGVWTVLQPTQTPAARTAFACAGDPATGRAWLFGGSVGGVANGEFWQWQGGTWSALPSGPPPRAGAALCHDPFADSVLLYGGNGWNDTWEFRQGVWQQRLANFPPHLSTCRFAYDTARRRAVLVTFGLGVVEAWELDASRNWFSTNPPSRPALREGFHATYESLRQRVVVVDGVPSLGQVFDAEAFEWDGATWRSFGPEPRLSLVTAVAHVPGEGVVAHHGFDCFGTVLTHERPAVVTRFGSTCAVPAAELSASPPWLGRTLALRMPAPVGAACTFATGFSTTQSGATPLPFSLSGYGQPGCQLYVDPVVVQGRPATNGEAVLQVALPNAPGFVGLELHHQAFVVGGQVPFVASHGLTTRLGSLW
ncbi:MAG: hypothetical protein JNK49_00280 [Planctomycetes bacterium]|nr:hypothetical protein [Planctomycetota bacterium]